MTFEEWAFNYLKQQYSFYSDETLRDMMTASEGRTLRAAYQAGQAEARELVERMREAGISVLFGAKPIKHKSTIGADMSELENWRIRNLSKALAEADKFLGKGEV